MSAQPLQITPPESFTSSPPTPPPTDEKSAPSVSRILAEIRRHQDGCRPPTGQHWLRFSLDANAYEDLERQLRRDDLWDYHENKLRHDYFPRACIYVLRMPSQLHESLGWYITKELMRQLTIIGHSDSPAAIFAQDIDNSASGKVVPIDTTFGPHEPDASYQHFDAQYPGVILEISYTQKKKDLARLAHEYILGSDADIRVVIGLDVEYKGSRKASVSIWRPRIEVGDDGDGELCVAQTVTDQLFRDDEGNFIPDSQANLELLLEDFGTEAFATKFPDLTETICISAETLFGFLERAETLAKRIRQTEGLARTTKPWSRKRLRDKTPPEQLDAEREARFVEEEKRAAKRAMKDDVSYKASSSDVDLE